MSRVGSGSALSGSQAATAPRAAVPLPRPQPAHLPAPTASARRLVADVMHTPHPPLPVDIHSRNSTARAYETHSPAARCDSLHLAATTCQQIQDDAHRCRCCHRVRVRRCRFGERDDLAFACSRRDSCGRGEAAASLLARKRCAAFARCACCAGSAAIAWLRACFAGPPRSRRAAPRRNRRRVRPRFSGCE